MKWQKKGLVVPDSFEYHTYYWPNFKFRFIIFVISDIIMLFITMFHNYI